MVYSEFLIENTRLVYYINKFGNCSLAAYPAGEDFTISDETSVDSMVQVKIAGEKTGGGYSSGVTMRNGAEVLRIRPKEQKTSETDGEYCITTYLSDGEGNEYAHFLKYYKGCGAFSVETEYANETGRNVTLELLASGTIAGIMKAGSTGKTNGMTMHRVRSFWSIEGRFMSADVADLGLEDSWAKHGVRCERFGALGSMPNKVYTPFAAIADSDSSTVWAMALEAPFSWQIEAYKVCGGISLGGGMADYEFGHWRKIIEPGERFRTRRALFAVSACGLNTAMGALVKTERRIRIPLPESEKTLPIIYNEYCSSWGNPTQESVLSLAKEAARLGIDYFVIDAGWNKSGNKNWSDSVGDWKESKESFPRGFKYVADRVRALGMVPGLWFEMENCAAKSDKAAEKDEFLRLFGETIRTKDRVFLDLRKKSVIDFLDDKVIGLLEKEGFGYVKIDYNADYGIGCDGAESVGEGGRAVAEKSLELFEKITKAGIVLENCASGGHRLEPARMRVSSMASITDAHECECLPVIAAWCARLMPAEQSQIWAVLRRTDSVKRLVYSLAATFLGRMGLSGEIDKLDEKQREVLLAAIDFYRSASEVIGGGVVVGCENESRYYDDLRGKQVVRMSLDGEVLIVAHFFNDPTALDVDTSGYEIVRAFTDREVKTSGNRIVIDDPAPMSAAAFLLKKVKKL